jgi:hypothetical protein
MQSLRLEPPDGGSHVPFVAPVVTMPVGPLSEEEKKAAGEAAGADLRFLLAKEGIKEELQLKLFHVGVTSVARLAAFADSVEDLKAVLKSDFELDPTTSLAARVELAGAICAFSAAVARSAKVHEIEGELDARQLTKPLPVGDLIAMKRAYETRWHPLDDKDTPAAGYLESKLKELERGELRAETLATVCSREEEEPDVLRAQLTVSGSLAIQRGSTKVDLPAGPEALRRRIGLLGNGLMMLGFRHTNRSELDGLTPQLFHDYVSYLLGDFVFNLMARNPAGEPVSAPAWSQVLHYELSIRKHAWKLVEDKSLTFAAALKAAMNDPTVKERHFTTPLALQAAAAGPAKRTWASSQEDSTSEAKKGKKGNTKGSKKDKGVGKGKHHGATTTPDGQPICFSYNAKGSRCTHAQCKFAHCCSICFGAHPAFKCKGRAEGSNEAAGSGIGGQGETRGKA